MSEEAQYRMTAVADDGSLRVFCNLCRSQLGGGPHHTLDLAHPDRPTPFSLTICGRCYNFHFKPRRDS
jgi:hypothetical protein